MKDFCYIMGHIRIILVLLYILMNPAEKSRFVKKLSNRIHDFLSDAHCGFRRRTGGTSRKLQAVDGVKTSISLCAILCGIALIGFDAANVGA